METLLNWVRSTSGANRDLDHMIAERFGSYGPNGTLCCAGYIGVGSFTGSVDGALKLVDQEFPISPSVVHEMSHFLARDGEEFWTFRIKVYSDDREEPPITYSETAYSAPLAILGALFGSLGGA